MNYGVAIFFTDYSISPVEMGNALEERGFESLWAPEHSHIPLTRRSSYPQGGDLPKKYYDVMDPFVKLTEERVRAMREIWTKPKPEFNGTHVKFGPMMTWPKPIQKPLPVIVGGMYPHGARRAIAFGDAWMPHATRPEYGESDVLAHLP